MPQSTHLRRGEGVGRRIFVGALVADDSMVRVRGPDRQAWAMALPMTFSYIPHTPPMPYLPAKVSPVDPAPSPPLPPPPPPLPLPPPPPPTLPLPPPPSPLSSPPPSLPYYTPSLSTPSPQCLSTAIAIPLSTFTSVGLGASMLA